MVTLSPICALPVPDLSDQINITDALGDLALAADHQAVARFSTTTARNSAIPNPIFGQVCFCADTGELYVYKKQYSAWVSACPRVRRLTSNVTSASQVTFVDLTDLYFSVEANSQYYGRMNLAIRGDTTGDITMIMEGPASTVVRATHIRIIAQTGTGVGHTEVNAFTTWHTNPIVLGLVSPNTVYNSANFQFWVDVAGTSGSVGPTFHRNTSSTNASEVSANSVLEVWKIK